MGKLAQNFAKYVVHARMRASGVVERPDVIGAIFGQTEGLLGTDLDLRELQHTGRIGRIDVDVKTNRGKSYARISIPSSLDASETALIAASLETIDKVGPCSANIEIKKVEDVRTQKRKYVIGRAKEILRSMMDSSMPDSHKMSESIKESVRSWEVSKYAGLSCGPEVKDSDEIIVVEGRADVINLLKNGIRNCIAIEGSKIPKAVSDLTRQKVTTAFLDGDRGGDLDLKKLLAVAEIDFVTRADEDMEVEDLSKKQIFKALREKVPVDQLDSVTKKSPPAATDTEATTGTQESSEVSEEEKQKFEKVLEDLIGTKAACLVDSEMNVLAKVPLPELSDVIDDFGNIHAVVFDGKINQSIVDMADKRRIQYLVGMGFKERVRHSNVQVITMKDLK